MSNPTVRTQTRVYKNKLTQRQARFLEEYIIDYNSTQAAIRAGYSQHTAGSIGVENLTKPLIKQELGKRLDQITNKNQDKVAYVIQSLTEISRNMDSEKLQHRLKALELLGKHLGMWQDRVDITSAGDKLPDRQVNITFEEIKCVEPDEPVEPIDA